MSEDQELLAAATKRVGLVLNEKYRIDRVLGVGGMAAVYAATHRNRKRFAVKMLHHEFAVRRDLRQRFVREGYVANSVEHPNVVAVLDDDVDETGAPFLIMELLEGATVEALSGGSYRSPVPVREALAIAFEVLDVLDTAHQKSIVHRDIKPANLFVTTGGEVKVLDFGIARLREADAGLRSTKTGAMLGTPAFMAPEQARAESAAIDARTDVWAVGATLFTMLSAQFVHSGDNARQIMIRAATEPARSLADVAAELPSAVIELVTRALSFERDARWQSAGAMREAVLVAHRELFGPLTRSHLQVLLEQSSKPSIETSPTEPSPQGSSQKTFAYVPGTPVAPSQALLTTTSRPVATGGRNAAARLPRPVVLGAVALVAIGAFAMLRSRAGGESKPARDAKAVIESGAKGAFGPLAAATTLGSASQARADATEMSTGTRMSGVAPTPPPSIAASLSVSSRVTAQRPAASSTRSVAHDAQLTRPTAAATTHARPSAKPQLGDAPPAPSSQLVAASKALPANPLQLELQR